MGTKDKLIMKTAIIFACIAAVTVVSGEAFGPYYGRPFYGLPFCTAEVCEGCAVEGSTDIPAILAQDCHAENIKPVECHPDFPACHEPFKRLLQNLPPYQRMLDWTWTLYP